MHAKEGGKGKMGETSLRLSFFSFPWSLALPHQSLACLSRFALPSEEEEAAFALSWYLFIIKRMQYIDTLDPRGLLAHHRREA